MKIANTFQTVKTLRGRVRGFMAHYVDLGTWPERATKPEAENDLAAMVRFRCDRESARVRVVTLCGHTGIFSYDLQGCVETQHVSPGQTGVCTGLSVAKETFEQAEKSFRYHVAQLTWNGLVCLPDYLPIELHSEFLSWIRFQLRFRIAIKNGMTDRDAHSWACDESNSFVEETAAA